MPVRFILAPAGGGKTHYCLNAAAEADREDPLGKPVYLILPEQATFIHERLLCETRAGGGFCRARVFSFNRLVYLAHRQQGKPALPPISEAGKLLLAGKVISARRDDISVYARSAASPGFADYLVKAAEEMAAYNVTPDELEAAVARMESEEGSSRQTARLREIALLCRDYQAASGGYAGYSQDMAFLAESVRRGFMAGCDVYVDGYADFTPAERAVLAALMADGSRTLYVTLPVDPRLLSGQAVEHTVFSGPLHCYGQLSEMAEKLGAEVLPPVLLRGERGRFSRSRELAALEAGLAGRGRPYAGKPQSVFLHRAEDVRAELEGIGRQIIRLTREQGLKYRQIGVVTRDTDGYEQLLAQVFGELDIPYFVDAKKPLISHPLFELFRAALECWAYHPAYPRIMRYAKNPLLPVSREEADVLDEYSRSHGLRFWHWLAEEPWQFPPMPDEPEDMAAQAEAVRQKACGPLLAMLRCLPDELTAAEINKALLAVFRESGVEEAMAVMTEQALAENRGEDASRHGQAWQKLSAFLEESALLLGEEKFAAGRLLKLYDAALSGLTVSTIPPGLDQVFVSSLERSRTPELAAAFVISLNDGVLPRRLVNDGLFTDEDRRGLRARGVALAADTCDRQFQEEYFAYVALTRSGSRLYLSYAERDKLGGELKPSPLLRQVKQALPELTEENYAKMTPGLLVGGETDLARMATALSGGEDGFWGSVYAWFAEDLAYAPALAKLRQGLTYVPFTGSLAPETRKKLGDKKLRGSVSRFERFRLCPFAWFAGYGLKLRRRREYELDEASRGELYHQVMADIGRYVLEKGLDWKDIDEKKAEELVDASLTQYLPSFLAGILKSSARYAYLSGRIRETLIGAVLLLAEHVKRGSFIPVAWELPFGSGEKGSLPAFRIDMGDGRVLELSGRIDRVDMAAGKEKSWFRIIDYKSGELKLKPEDIFAGLRLQLLVYLQVVLANANVFAPGEAAAGGVYYSRISDKVELSEDDDRLPDLKLTGLTLRDEEAVRLADSEISGYSELIPMGWGREGLYKNQGLDEDTFALLQERLLQLLRETAGQMLDGLISVSPLRDGDFDACAYCDYAAVCGFDKDLAKRRKRDLKGAEALVHGEGGEE